MLSQVYASLHIKYRLFFSGLKEPAIFSTDFRKKYIGNFMNICPMLAELFFASGQTDRQTDMTDLLESLRSLLIKLIFCSVVTE